MHPAVDLHCHILPGLDDGAEDLDDAIGMARQAEADGITAICATPHIRADHEVRLQELPQRRAALETALAAAGCTTRVLPGGEVSVTALDGLDDGWLRALTLGGTGRWILLEPAPGPIDERLELSIGRLQEGGFRVVIAHPERHLAPDLPERLRRLVASGSLVQATAEWLWAERTRPGMLALARAGTVHLLGSDAHSSRWGRAVTLSPALDVLATVPSLSGHLEWIARLAPEAIVRGEDVTPPF